MDRMTQLFSVVPTGIVFPEQFGAVGDGVTDDYAAFVQWVAHAGSDRLGLNGLKTYALASASLGLAGLALPNGAYIEGVGMGNPNIVVTGSTPCNLFKATDIQNITVKNCWIVGNGADVTSYQTGAGSFLNFRLTSKANSPNGRSGLFMENVRVDWFYGPWWVGFWCEDSSTTIAACQITHCRFYSGGAPLPSATQQSCMISIGNPAFAGPLTDVQINNCYGGGYGVIKSFINVWNTATHVVISDNVLEGFGQGIAQSSYGCNAIQVQSTGYGYPDVISISGNQIISPWSSGVWASGVANIDISGNYCSGQNDWPLSAAFGVAGLQSGATCNIERNTALNCMTGVCAPSSDGAVANVSNNVSVSNVAYGQGIYVVADTGLSSQGLGVVNVFDNHVNHYSAGNDWGLLIADNSQTGDRLGEVNVVGGTYMATQAGIITSDNSNGLGCYSGKIMLRDLLVSGALVGNQNQNAAIMHRQTAAALTIDGVTIDGTQFSSNTCACWLDRSTALNVIDLTIRNFPDTSGAGTHAIFMNGARGSMTVGAVKFVNCSASQFSSTDFGAALPTWAADKGTQIANLVNPGVGPQGWLNTNATTTGWQPTGAGAFLPLTGGTINGNLNVTGNADVGGFAYATTAVTGDNSTKLATTAYVQAAVEAGGIVGSEYLPLTGGTLSGPLAVNAPGSTYFALNDAAGENRQLLYETAGLARWSIYAGPGAETGSNAGSNLYINSYADNGTNLATPLSINRATGLMTLSNNLQVEGGNIYVSGAAATWRGLQIDTNNSARWWITADNAAETGSDVGSDLAIYSYHDSGANIGMPLTINRASGVTTLGYGLNIANGVLGWGATGYSEGYDGTNLTISGPSGPIIQYPPAGGANLYGNLSVRGAVTMTSNLTVQGSTGITGNETVGGNFQVNGTAQGVTPAAADNSTNFATTAWVHGALSSIGGGSYLPLTGGTLTGALTVNAPGQSQINITDTAGNVRALNYETAGSARWQISVGSGAESGSNAGSNLFINSYADNGTFLATPLSFARSTSNATFAGSINMQGQILTIGPVNYPAIIMNKPAGSNTSIQIIGETAGLYRWDLMLGDGGAESGGNAGTNFSLAAYDDNGNGLGSYFNITRSNAAANFAGSITCSNVNAWGNVATNGGGAAFLVGSRSGGGEYYQIYNNGDNWLRMWGSTPGDMVLFGDTETIFYHTLIVGQAPALRMLPSYGSGGYGSMWYNDGSSTYLLLTNSNDALGGWNGLRPYQCDNSTGNVNMGSAVTVGGAMYMNASANCQGTMYFGGYAANQGGINAAGSQQLAIGAGVSGNLAQVILYANTTNCQGGITINGNNLTYGETKCYGYLCRQGYNGGWSAGGNHFNLYWQSPYMQIWVDNTNLGNFPSDYRIKRGIRDLGSMWDRVKKLRPIHYNIADYKPDYELNPLFFRDEVDHWGFVAHELQETLTPDAATGVKDEVNCIQSINPMPVIAALTKALQEAMQRIESLEAAVAARA